MWILGVIVKLQQGFIMFRSKMYQELKKKSLPLSSRWKGESKVFTCRLIC